METKKYEFTGETQVWNGHTLHRIRALISFGDVKVGELGGWIEKEENLSQDGDAWVYDEAWVYGQAFVSDEARVSGQARVSNDAWVSDEACVSGMAVVCDEARVNGQACVSGHACVSGQAWVCGSAVVCDKAMVRGMAGVSGMACIRRTNHYLCIGPMGSRLDFTTFFRSKDKQIYVKCGCFYGDIDDFALNVQATHGDSQHAKAYMAAVELAKAQIDLSDEE